jgi:alpha-mannosidase
MIDEEDDDEILKKGVSTKKVLKNLVLIALIIVGALFIYMGGAGQMNNFFIGFTLICIGSTLIQIQKKEEEPTRQTLSILKCEKCELTKVRNYESGDFVFKIVDSCENCNDTMKINQIYSVKLKKSTAKKQAKEKKLKDTTQAKT